MELDAAASAFAALGAAGTPPGPSRSPRRRLRGPWRAHCTGGACPGRHRQDHRDIADHLVISEKTVGSHLSHIFTKLGLSSRAAATAYAYEHELLS